MKYMKFILLAGSILILSCQQQEAPLQMTEQTAQEMIGPLAKSADNPGSDVVRNKISAWHFWFLDGEKCLLSLHVVHPLYCEVGEDVAELYEQLIIHPDHQQDLVMQLQKSKDHPLFVFDWSDGDGCLPWQELYTWECDANGCWITGFNCDLLDARLIASGTGQLEYNDNDLYHWLDHDRMRTNTFGGRGQGKLTDKEGNTYHYNAIYKQSWALNKDNEFYMETINFQMTGK